MVTLAAVSIVQSGLAAAIAAFSVASEDMLSTTEAAFAIQASTIVRLVTGLIVVGGVISPPDIE